MRSLSLLFLCAISAHALTPVMKCPSKSETEDLRKETVGYLVMPNGLCSGTLLSPQVVLTAAHCVKGLSPKDLLFTLQGDLSESMSSAPFAGVKEIRVLPLFRAPAGKSPGGADLAVVGLSSTNYGKYPLTFYEIADDTELTHGATAYTLGYGVEPNGSVKIRRSRRVRFDERREAQLANGERLKGGLLRFVRGDDGQIPCGGDSGSPILKFVGTKTHIVAVHSSSQAFITSPRQRASLENSPWKLCQVSASAFATSLGKFKDWIETNRREMEPNRAHTRCP